MMNRYNRKCVTANNVEITNHQVRLTPNDHFDTKADINPAYKITALQKK